MTRCRGLLRSPTPANVVKFGAHVGGAKASPACDWHAAVKSWPMLLNNINGTCVPAAMLHLVQMRETNASGVAWLPSDAQVAALYSALTGYDPLTGKPDDGTDVATALAYWAQTGLAIADQTTDVCLPVSLNPADGNEIRLAIQEFGGVALSLALPNCIDDQFEAGQPFDVPTAGLDSAAGKPGGGGEHEVCSGRYTADGALWIVTWGGEMLMTPAAQAAYIIAADTGFSAEWLDVHGLAPSGVDRAGLIAALAGYAGG
jgi:hypothetical protein